MLGTQAIQDCKCITVIDWSATSYMSITPGEELLSFYRVGGPTCRFFTYHMINYIRCLHQGNSCLVLQVLVECYSL